MLAGLPVEPRARAIAIATDERLCTRWRATMVAFKRGCRPLRVGSEFRNELTSLGRVVHSLAFPRDVPLSDEDADRIADAYLIGHRGLLAEQGGGR